MRLLEKLWVQLTPDKLVIFHYLSHFFLLQGKILGNQWKQLSNDAKAEYEEQADADKNRYQKEMEDYSPPLDASAPKDDADEKKAGAKKDQSSKKETPKSTASPNKKRKTPPVSVASANLFAAFLKKKKTE